jgi:hypothetical protein
MAKSTVPTRRTAETTIRQMSGELKAPYFAIIYDGERQLFYVQWSGTKPEPGGTINETPGFSTLDDAFIAALWEQAGGEPSPF